jgi:hypothetical protein
MMTLFTSSMPVAVISMIEVRPSIVVFAVAVTLTVLPDVPDEGVTESHDASPAGTAAAHATFAVTDIFAVDPP